MTLTNGLLAANCHAMMLAGDDDGAYDAAVELGHDARLRLAIQAAIDAFEEANGRIDAQSDAYDDLKDKVESFENDLGSLKDEFAAVEDFDRLVDRVVDLEEFDEREMRDCVSNAESRLDELEDDTKEIDRNFEAFARRVDSVFANLDEKRLDDLRSYVDGMQALGFFGRLRWLLTGRVVTRG